MFLSRRLGHSALPGGSCLSYPSSPRTDPKSEVSYLSSLSWNPSLLFSASAPSAKTSRLRACSYHSSLWKKALVKGLEHLQDVYRREHARFREPAVAVWLKVKVRAKEEFRVTPVASSLDCRSEACLGGQGFLSSGWPTSS